MRERLDRYESASRSMTNRTTSAQEDRAQRYPDARAMSAAIATVADADPTTGRMAN